MDRYDNAVPSNSCRWIAQFRYVKDNDGYPYPGGMHTSPVTSVSISENEKIVKIETAHTIYTFEKVKED